MKRILFLFTASLLLLACSKDSENPQDTEEITEPTEYKIKKFSITEYYGNGDIYIHDILYDESGKISNRINHFEDFTISLNDTYSYNSRDQITTIQQSYEQENMMRRTLKYVYTEISHQLFEIQNIDPDGQNSNTIKFAQMGDTVYTQDNLDFRSEYIWDANKRLVKSHSSGGDIGYFSIQETINYSGNLINSLHYLNVVYPGGEYLHTYEYDNHENPLFDDFSLHTKDYIYGFLGGPMTKFSHHFSANNYTRMEYANVNDPSENYIQTKTTQYNEDGYPISAVVKRNDVVIEELAYEYY